MSLEWFDEEASQPVHVRQNTTPCS